MESVWMNILNIISPIAGICSTTFISSQIMCDQNVLVKTNTALLLNQKLQQTDLMLDLLHS